MLTSIMDCCHSGTGMDLAFVHQIKPSSNARGFDFGGFVEKKLKKEDEEDSEEVSEDNDKKDKKKHKKDKKHKDEDDEDDEDDDDDKDKKKKDKKKKKDDDEDDEDDDDDKDKKKKDKKKKDKKHKDEDDDDDKGAERVHSHVHLISGIPRHFSHFHPTTSCPSAKLTGITPHSPPRKTVLSFIHQSLHSPSAPR